MLLIKNTNHWLAQIALLNNDEATFIYKSKEYSFSDILSLSKKTANYLHQKGIKVKDHVAIVSDNNLEFIIVINALWLLGVIPIPLNVRQSETEIKRLVVHSKSKFIININDALKYKLNINEIGFTKKNIYKLKESNYAVQFACKAIALMMYTSGSTGLQKCVELTFNNLYASAKSVDGLINHSIKDKWLASLPFYHIGGFSIIVRVLLSGCSLIIPISLKQPEMEKSFKDSSPSLISLVPTMLLKFLNSGLSSWKSLRFLFIGGGPSNSKLINMALEKQFPICLVYGSTETSSMVTACSTKKIKLNGISVGTAFNGVEIILIDENGDEVDKNYVGRVAIKSESVALRYFNLTEDENNSFVNEMYISNDIGKIDQNGNLNIIGRKDNIIISGGEKISLSEIEKILMDEYKIEDCVAVGIRDEKWGQSYVLVIKAKAEDAIEHVKKLLKTELADYKLPKNIFHVKNIPRNELGKINKNQLKKLVNQNVL